MLSQQDFSMLESMMERVVGTALTTNNAEMKEYIDERFEQNNAEMRRFVRTHVKEATNESEKILLDEINRYYNFSKREMQKLSAKIDDIAGYYRIRKSEDRQYEYLFRLYLKQQKEIDEIKQVLVM